MNSTFILVAIAFLLIALYEFIIHPMVLRARNRRSALTFTIGQPECLTIQETLVIDQELNQPMSERVLVLMQRAKHPMTAGMVMRRLYRWEKRNFFLFQLVRSNLQALVRDGSARCWKSSRGNSVYEVHA